MLWASNMSFCTDGFYNALLLGLNENMFLFSLATELNCMVFQDNKIRYTLRLTKFYFDFATISESDI